MPILAAQSIPEAWRLPVVAAVALVVLFVAAWASPPRGRRRPRIRRTKDRGE